MKDEYISINKLALLLDVSVNTIKRWYKWWEDPDYDKPEDLYLPEYVFLDRRKARFFLKSDLSKFKKFQKQLNTSYRGIMAQYNANHQWGIYGKEYLRRKDEDNE